MEHEMFLRDDIIELSSKLDAQCFNVKAYRKRSSVTSSRNSKKPFAAGQVAASSEVQSTKYDASAEKSQRVTEVLSSKRLSVTAGVRKRSHVSDSMNQNMTKTAMSRPNNCIDEVDEQPIQRDTILLRSKKFIGQVSQKKQNKFTSLQKKYSKGGVKDKHIENWLNQILIEYCSQEKFDPTIQNSALKKFGIDKNTMLSKGISIENLGRLYKSLFVYSMGFNNLLKQVCAKNMNLKKTIWKVYAILLEYCAEGGFQTMIGQIQRDKARKLQSLKDQIQKRQSIINNNQEANQQRNAKIFKEIKILKQQNKNLQNDKIVILQDFKQTEQAFNEQVSLRLRFQNKINQIHGVHRQLMIKHQRLYDDFKVKLNQNNGLQDKFNKLNEKYTVLTNDHNFATKQLTQIKKQNKYNTELVGQLKQTIKSLQYGNIESKNAKLDLISVIAQKQRKNSQLILEMKNVELILKMIDDSQKELKKQYDKSLEDNQRLIQTIHEQMVQINELLANKKSFNDQHAAMEAHIQLEKQKNQSKKQQIQGFKNKINELKDIIDQKDVYIGSLENINQSLNKDLQDCYKKIEEMKRVKDILEEDLNEYKKKDETYNLIFQQKQKKIQLLTSEKQNLERELSEFVIMKKSLQTKINLLNQKLTSTEQINKKKIQKFKEEVANLRTQNEKYKMQWSAKVLQLEKYIKLYEDTFGKLRNELFERGDLELRYKQSLTVVQSQTSHIKDLTIKISEYIERDQEQCRKIKNLEYILVSKEKLFKSQIELRDKSIHKYLAQLKESKGYIHPMLYEDALSMIQRQSIKSNSIINSLTENLKQQTSQKTKFKKESQKSAQQSKDLLTKYEIQMNKKNMEIEYQKQKSKSLKVRLQEIELSMQGMKSGGGSSSKGSFRDKQKKYLDIIKQKSTEIQQMIKQAEKMHDHNNQLLINLNKAETQLRQNKEVLMPLKQHIAQMEAKVQQLEEEKIHLQKEYEVIQNKYDSSERKKSSQNQEDKSQFSGQIKSKQSNRNQSRSNQHNSQQKNIDSQHQNQEKTANNLGWRNDMGKKIRNAYQYYHK